jgi:hypothetical protein
MGTDTPLILRRPVPKIDAQTADRLTGVRHGRVVLWLPFDDPNDQHVFAGVIAVQVAEGERWLVRGALRREPGKKPTMSRVAVEHLTDRDREPTGTVIRGINLATIRDDALRDYHRSAWSHDHLSAPAPQRREATRDATSKAGPPPPARHAHGAYPISHYWRIGAMYLELANAGERNIHAVIGEREGVGRETARTWVAQATRLKILPPGRRGVTRIEPGLNFDLYRPKEEDNG